MVGGVVAYAMSLGQNLLYQMGIKFGIFAETEEGCFGIVLGESFENELCDAGCGAVVEGQIDAVAAIDLPQHCGHQSPYEFREVEIHFLSELFFCNGDKGINFFYLCTFLTE